MVFGAGGHNETFSLQYKEVTPLMGRSAILGEQRNNYFCDVGCGRGEMGDSTYAITKSGLLCEFNNRRLLDKWVELRVRTTVSPRFFPYIHLYEHGFTEFYLVFLSFT